MNHHLNSLSRSKTGHGTGWDKAEKNGLKQEKDDLETEKIVLKQERMF